MQNAKVAFILLGAVIIALVIGLFYVWNKGQEDLTRARTEIKDAQIEIEALNSQLKTKKEELRVREETETALKGEVEKARQEAATAQQQLAKVTNDLFATSLKLKEASQTVSVLTTEKKALQGNVQNLNAKVASLDQRIAKLENELDRSEKNRALVLQELAGLRIEKAGLEKKFNDIGEVRGQYKVLRHDEVLESRRRWMAQGDGFYTKTGHYQQPKPYVSPASQYDVKSEIRWVADTNRAVHSVSDKPAK
jgi:uncharacterized protein (DUF3084 family)